MELEHFEALYPDAARLTEIGQIARYIKEGSSCQLIGLPGSGRSTLLSLLAHNRQVRAKHFGDKHKAVHFVMVNFSEVRKRSLFDVMKFLFLNLTESLRERRMLEENKAVGDIFREHLKFGDELILFQGFKEAIDYLGLKKEITVVFLFDRFEEYLPMVTDAFFTNLRTLRNRAKYKFSVVFSLYRPLETFLESAVLADFYEFVAGHVVYLPLSDAKTTDFRVAYIEKITEKKISPDNFKQILELTGGVGRLVKLAVEAVLVAGGKTQSADFLLSQKPIKNALLEIWSILTPAEQTALLRGQYDDAEVAQYLEQVGLIKEQKIQIPLLVTLLHSELGQEPTGKTRIVYDQATNTIRKGEELLSDQLTGSEFRLLVYFLHHPERIVEREELMSAVWGDNKSTAGITDQAIDQLIFRLRRKIEADPNNPVQLQTVKGRGFRFVS
jgi:hypothetical protein